MCDFERAKEGIFFFTLLQVKAKISFAFTVIS